MHLKVLRWVKTKWWLICFSMQMTLFFWRSEATTSNVVAIKTMLRCFKLSYGLKVNFHKSCFADIGVEFGELERWTSILNCKLMSGSFTYLGFPIGAGD